MRSLLIAALVVSLGQAAHAADWPDDLPVLRGGFSDTAGRSNWEGWYVGGQFGYSAATLDMGNAQKSLTGYMLRNTILQEPVGELSMLGSQNAAGFGFGGFVGRNWQWEDAVVGLEINYSNLRSIQAGTSGQLGVIISPAGSNPPPGHTYSYGTNLSGSASAEVKDLMTLRARAGWDAGGFMPYAFAGVALGRVNVTRSATLGITRYDDYSVQVPTTVNGAPVIINVPRRDFADVSPSPSTRSEGGVDSIAGGYTFGVGTEMKITGGLFLRAEWEYVKLLKVKDVAVSVNSARVGVGYKF